LTLLASRFIRPEKGVEREQGRKKHYVETNREPIKRDPPPEELVRKAKNNIREKIIKTR